MRMPPDLRGSGKAWNVGYLSWILKTVEFCWVIGGEISLSGWKNGLGQRPEGRTVCAMSKSVLAAWGMGLRCGVWGVKRAE